MRNYFWCLFFVGYCFMHTVCVADAKATFHQTINDARLISSLQKQTENRLKNFNPTHSIANFNQNNATVSHDKLYFKGVDQSSDYGLNQDAVKSVQTNQAGQAVETSFKTRPIFKIDPTSTLLTHSKLFIDDANHIARGQSDQYVDCRHEKVCKTQYKISHCSTDTRTTQEICKKVASVSVSTHQVSFPSCGHLIDVNDNARVPNNSRYIGPWYPCHFDYRQHRDVCQKIYWVSGQQNNQCVVSAVSYLSKNGQAQGFSMTVPKGFPLTLEVQDHGGICGRYGTDKNHASASALGHQIVLPNWHLDASLSLGKLDQSQSISVHLTEWNTDHNSCDQIGLAIVKAEAFKPAKKATVKWTESCHA